MITLYIAGPMSNLPDYNRPAFFAAEEELRAAGYETLNPARTSLGPDAEWADYMRVGLRQVLDADGIALLPEWFRSRGAKLEEHVAHQLGMPVRPQSTWIIQARIEKIQDQETEDCKYCASLATCEEHGI